VDAQIGHTFASRAFRGHTRSCDVEEGDAACIQQRNTTTSS
jgi:hypothetical protein